MTDPNNNLNDKPTEEQQSSDETQTELREISKKELEQILEDHTKWLESDEKEGVQADLSRANLQEANLKKANLQKANLKKANLQKADLYKSNLQQADLGRASYLVADPCGANLQKANLIKANLQEASLHGANLQQADLYKADMQNTVLDSVNGLSEANLQYANLEGATGLLGNEFAQADLTGTKLPKNIEEFKALEIVIETSQNARKIFFAMLLGCVYSWLTIATTTDVKLLTNTASSPLPIIGTEIPIAWFYIAAPLVLICLYFYFHLYLLKLWEGLSGLPAKFPDGKRLDERAYPWLLNGLVRRQFRLLKTERPFIAHIQEWITIFLAWWVVPITMIAFWLRYIPRHDWFGTIFHIGLIVISVAFAIIFYRLCALSLQGKEKVTFRFKAFWGDRRFHYGVGVVIVGVIFSLLSYGSIYGIRLVKPKIGEIKEVFNFYDIKVTVPWAFEEFGYDVFADFSEKDVSEKPDNYWEIHEKNHLNSVKGAKLKNMNLNNANMNGTFLVKADFRDARLNRATLEYANLQKANLWKAKLQKANLEVANIEEAILSDANLQQANLIGANLQQANLVKAKLQQANLTFANMQNADLTFANLQQANLWKANLQHANLLEVNLQQANLVIANLQQASLNNADLTGAKNLTIEQLSKVKTLYKAKLDPDLMEQVKKCCPHLLEEPKKEQEQTN